MKPYPFGRNTWLAGLAALTLVGCTSTAATTPKVLADFPLFTNADGMASLTVTIVDGRRSIQDYSEVTEADRVRFTLTSSRNLTGSGKVATDSITLGASQTFGRVVFSGLRPDNDYYLRADLYKQSDLTNESSFTQNVVRAAGISGALALTAGAATQATIKINSVGSVTFSGSENSNRVDDYKVIEGDRLAIDTGMTSTKNPLVRRIEVDCLKASDLTPLGTKLSTTTLTTSAATFSWTVPTITGSQESAVLYVTGHDATSGGKQITMKTVPVIIYKGATVGAGASQITLN